MSTNIRWVKFMSEQSNMPEPIKKQFDSSKLLKTSGWYNNCGLNCLTHFFAAKLESGELQQLVSDSPEYQELLRTFQTYYDLPKQPSWGDIKTLFDKYPTPTDKEAIFSPVLRKHLPLLRQMKRGREKWWDTFSAAYTDYLKDGEIEEVARPVFNANQAWFENDRAEFQKKSVALQSKKITPKERKIAEKYLAENKREITESTLRERVLFQRSLDLQDSFLKKGKQTWLEEGCENYARYLGELSNNVMIDVSDLEFLAKSFGISLEIYRNEELYKISDDDFLWKMKVSNNGIHWELLATDNQDIDQHNKCYPDEFFEEEFFGNDALSGQFKIFGDHGYEEGLLDKIKNAVQTHFAALKNATPATSSATPSATTPSVPSTEGAKEAQMPWMGLLLTSMIVTLWAFMTSSIGNAITLTGASALTSFVATTLALMLGSAISFGVLYSLYRVTNALSNDKNKPAVSKPFPENSAKLPGNDELIRCSNVFTPAREFRDSQKNAVMDVAPSLQASTSYRP